MRSDRSLDGNAICLSQLRSARCTANAVRINCGGRDDGQMASLLRFALGQRLGSLNIAAIWMSADADAVMAAENEITFLLRDYLIGGR